MVLAKIAAEPPEGQARNGDADHQSDRNQPNGPAIKICHQLPNRLRLRFQPPLSPEARLKIHAALEVQWPTLAFRDSNQGQGLVIHSEDFSLCSEQLIATIEAALAQPRVHWVAAPPNDWERAQDQLRQGSIKVLMALAVAGWVLPILPGTPFFLAAWWLGWRPSANPSDAESAGPNPHQVIARLFSPKANSEATTP